MKFLILVNNAPNYYPFFYDIASELKGNGHEVLFAFHSKLAEELYPALDKTNNFPVLYFSDYLLNVDTKTSSSFERFYQRNNIYRCMFSDFDRFSTVGYNLGYSAADYDKISSAYYHFFSETYHKYNIDAVLYENVSNSYAYFAYEVAKARGVEYLGIVSSRLPGRFSIVGDPLAESELLGFDGTLKHCDLLSNEGYKYIDEYLTTFDHVQPDYMKFNNLDNLSIVNKYLKVGRFKHYFRIANYSLKNEHSGDFQSGNPLKLSMAVFMRSFYRRIKSLFIDKYYQDIESIDCDYYLYPLHFHPESSTSVLCPNYVDEYSVIKNIAFNLPFGTRLVVKDHMSSYGLPSIDFYKKISQIPNVILVNHNANVKSLVRRSRGVITLSSTVGYEALLLGKQVFHFADVFYSVHKNAHKIKTYDGIFRMLVDSPVIVNDEALQKYNKGFLASYYLSSYKGVLNIMNPADGTARTVAEAICELMNESEVPRRA